MTSSTKLKTIDTIIAFTDGSCVKQKNKENICGYGVHFPNGELKDISKKFTHEPLTNQRTELYAIYKAIKKADEKYNFKSMMIYSDSEYSIKSLTLWINSWKKNGWMTANKKPVLNTDIIQDIDELLIKHKGKIKFEHVMSHTNKTDYKSLCNDVADQLAKAGGSKN